MLTLQLRPIFPNAKLAVIYMINVDVHDTEQYHAADISYNKK